MNLEVDYIDQRNRRSNVSVKITYLQFLKSFVVAGQGRMPTVATWKEMFGSNITYGKYLRTRFFRDFSFKTAAGDRFDPTAQGDFSTLVGKAFADILAKRLGGATITFGYEAALKQAGLNLIGRKPDMLCTSPTSTFTLESKGFAVASVSDNEMKQHKAQARSGQIRGDFHVACVSYNLYDKPKCKYHDPESTGNKASSDLIRDLVRSYYEGWNSFLRMPMTEISKINIAGRFFYLISQTFTKVREYLEPHHILFDVSVLEDGMNGVVPATGLTLNSGYFFIDTDGVGLCSDHGADLLRNNSR